MEVLLFNNLAFFFVFVFFLVIVTLEATVMFNIMCFTIVDNFFL